MAAVYGVECNDPFLSSAGDVADVVQRADL